MQSTVFRFTLHLKDVARYIYPDDCKIIGIDARWKALVIVEQKHDYALTSSTRFNDNKPGYIYDDIEDFCGKNDLIFFRAYINGIYGFIHIFSVDKEFIENAIAPEYLIRDSLFDGIASVVWFDGGVPENILTKYLCRGHKYIDMFGKKKPNDNYTTQISSAVFTHDKYDTSRNEVKEISVGAPNDFLYRITDRGFKNIIENIFISPYMDFGVEKANLPDAYADVVLSVLTLVDVGDFTSSKLAKITINYKRDIDGSLHRFGIIVYNMQKDIGDTDLIFGRIQIDA